MKCWKCGAEIDVRERIEFRAACPGCDQALHSCRNCAHYDPALYNQCRETIAERVVNKERANFCELFTPAKGSLTLKKESSASARAQLEALFRKKST
jgi:hypothetical protein